MLGRAVFTGRLSLVAISPHPIDPLILSQTRAGFSLLLLLPTLLAVRGWRRIKLPAADLVRCFLLGTLGVAVSNYFYYVAIQRTNVATAIVVQYTAPVWVLLYVVARGQQKLSLQKIAAVALAVMGIVLVIGVLGGKTGTGFRLDSYGFIAALLASFSFAFYNIAGHGVLERHDRWLVLLWTLISASFCWLFLNPPWKMVEAHYGTAEWGFLLVFSLVSVLGPFSLYFHGLQYLEPTRAIIASCLEPVFSILLAAVFLGELMRPLQSLGIILVLASIVIVQRPAKEHHRQDASALVEPME